MIAALRHHWPEYLMEGAGLGLFMISACVFGVLLEYPGSPVHQAIADPLLRRALMGLAMGATAVLIIYSPWGKQSGAHINPAVTLTFLRLGKVEPWDAVFYVLAQCAGAILGVLLAAHILDGTLADPAVDYVVTRPGRHGAPVAFLAETAITFVLMLVILTVSNRMAIARWTGVAAAVLVALYITVEAPFSGMSMNPARSLGSAVAAEMFAHLWIYFVAPPLGMLAAAELHLRLARGDRAAVRCAKLHHHNDRRCIFRCGFAAAADERTVASAAPTHHLI